MVKEYIEKLKAEENYEEIKKFIKNYKLSKDEFLYEDAYGAGNMWLCVCFGAVLIISGVCVLLENNNILIRGLYILPFLFVSIKSFISCIKRNEKEYQTYKFYREDAVWKSIYFSFLTIYLIWGVSLSIFDFKLTDMGAITVFGVVTMIGFLLAIYFYYVTQKNLVKEYSGMKKKKEKKEKVDPVILGLAATVGITYTRNHGIGPWMMIGMLIISVVSLKRMISMYWGYKLIDFMEDEIYSYLPNTNKKKK
ncbi:hypothetical protein [uncultured Clostridium sp.]|jgi:hypothetical protein|uniref:hypothetical protein n=1 Tax=uncultured Clostridium sp. TaxID=59620 RepID=UPI002634AC2F|nr:hypothetical protein [uncultured Clostridium sp.]